MGHGSELVTAKSVLLVLMLIISGVFVLLPIGVMQIPRVKNGSVGRRKLILSLFNCFGGGIFVATGFLHLLPEVTEKMAMAYQKLFHKELHYPFAYFLVCVGFFTVLSIEHIVLSCVRQNYKPKVDHEVAEPTPPNCRCETIIRSGLPGVTASGLFSQSLVTARTRPPGIRRAKTSPNFGSGRFDSIEAVSQSTDPSDEHQEENQEETVKIMECKNQVITYSEDKTYSQSQVQIVVERSTLHAFTVALALSVHSVFEGLAFGLQDSINDVFQVFAAIAVHKAILAFSLGINFVTVKVRFRIVFLLTVIFCVASPIGGAIGTGLSSSDSNSVTITLLNAILQGLATGTFLYIAFIEVISYELTNLEPEYVSHGLLLVLSILIGFSTFAGLSFVHDH